MKQKFIFKEDKVDDWDGVDEYTAKFDIPDDMLLSMHRRSHDIFNDNEDVLRMEFRIPEDSITIRGEKVTYPVLVVHKSWGSEFSLRGYIRDDAFYSDGDFDFPGN